MWTHHAQAPHTLARFVERPGCVVGRFDCGPESPAWRTVNQIGGGPMVVFPSTAVEITHDGCPPVVANPNVVMFYNLDQPYTRRLLDRRGDHCAHFSVTSAGFSEIAAELDPAAGEEPGRPFRFDRGPGSPGSWLLHHALVRYLDGDGPPDDLFLEEAVLALVREVVGLAFRAHGRPSRGRAVTTVRHREAARHLEQILSLRPEVNRTLGELADQVGLSPFHAARVFRRHTGHSLHGYRNHLRLKTSLGRLADCDGLAELALDLGFSNHSHFSDQFRRVFGVAPSQVRGHLTTGRIRELERQIDRRLQSLDRARS